VNGGQASAEQRAPDLTGQVRTAYVRIRVVDIRDPAAERVRLDDLPGGLDLRKLRHFPP
jgi:hypothetical protein